jgi:hypothetical protein
MSVENKVNSLVNLCLWTICNNLAFVEELQNTSHIPNDIRNIIFSHLKGCFFTRLTGGIAL